MAWMVVVRSELTKLVGCWSSYSLLWSLLQQLCACSALAVCPPCARCEVVSALLVRSLCIPAPLLVSAW